MSFLFYRPAEKPSRCHCEERFLRRSNLKLIDYMKSKIASLRSQRRQKDFFNSLLNLRVLSELGEKRNLNFFISRKGFSR